jgi:hypothetical protein
MSLKPVHAFYFLGLAFFMVALGAWCYNRLYFGNANHSFLFMTPADDILQYRKAVSFALCLPLAIPFLLKRSKTHAVLLIASALLYPLYYFIILVLSD